VGKTRIITELGMPVQDAFEAPAHHEPGKVTVLGCIAGTLILVLTFSLTGCNGRCLTTPKLRLWDAAKWVTRCARLRRRSASSFAYPESHRA
jgi:hypothetical protein